MSALLSAGLVAATAGPATAAGCTVTLNTQTTYQGTDAAETVCITGTGDATYDIDTAGGNDTVKVLNGDAEVDADLGSGNDVYTAPAGSDDTVDGGTGNDKLTTGPGDDTISGGDGKDAITAGTGDDTVDGGTGDDKITGDAGNDTLAGGAGNDTITDKTGDDTLDGGTGDDKLSAGAGNDTVDGGAGADKIAGDAGNDDLAGGAGNDTITDKAGDDTLDGGTGDDKILAGNGIDLISGGDGADLMNGGAGDDAFDGTTTDTAVSGTGDAACSDESTLNLTCAYGAVVASVNHTVNTTATGWQVTVQARALDFEGVGVTKIALAENAKTTASGGGMYLSATPTLVSGTTQNGVFEATFDLATIPANGHMGVRVFTTGFSVDALSICDFEGGCSESSDLPIRWPCVSWSLVIDDECGVGSPLGVMAAGFPKEMRAVVFDGAAHGEDGLSGYVLSPPPTDGIDRTLVLPIPFAPPPTTPEIACRSLGLGSHTFKVATFTTSQFPGQQFPSVDDFGWSLWSPGTTWSKTCSEVTRLTVSKAGAGSGTVSSAPAGIDCGTICTADFVGGDVVTLTVSSNVGSTFTGWSGGGCSGTGTCRVTMDAAKTVTATFTKVPTQTLTVDKTGAGAGWVSSKPSGIFCGDTCATDFNQATTVTLTAQPAPNSRFDGWSGAGCTGTSTCVVTMDAAKTVTAGFSLTGVATITSTCTTNINASAEIAFTFEVDVPATVTVGEPFTVTLPSRTMELSNNRGIAITAYSDIYTTYAVSGGTIVPDSLTTSGTATWIGAPVASAVSYPSATQFKTVTPGPLAIPVGPPDGTTFPLVMPEITFQVTPTAVGTPVQILAVQTGSSLNLSGVTNLVIATCPLGSGPGGSGNPTVLAQTNVVAGTTKFTTVAPTMTATPLGAAPVASPSRSRSARRPAGRRIR